MALELNEQQWRAVQEQAGCPVEVIDPNTRRAYVLIDREQYDRVRSMLPSEPVSARPTELSRAVPPGILRAQEAFWSDLPQLLKQSHLRGQWVCYAGDERIGIARTQAALIQLSASGRGLRDDEFDLGRDRAPCTPSLGIGDHRARRARSERRATLHPNPPPSDTEPR